MMRYPGVGHSAHGLVLYQQYFLLLDSQAARLVALDIVTGDITEMWKVGGRRRVEGGQSTGAAAFAGAAPEFMTLLPGSSVAAWEASDERSAVAVAV
jgi:hypothetical protein